MIIPQFSKNQNDDFYNEELSKALQNGLSDNGWTPPQQSSENIDTIKSDMPDGTFWYDTDLNALVTKQDGVLKKIVTEDL